MVFPHLSDVARKYKDRGLRVVGINIEDDSNSLDQFVQGQGAKMDYTVRGRISKHGHDALRHAPSGLTARMQRRWLWELLGSS